MLRVPRKMQLILWKTTKRKYCACHTKRLSARYQTGCNVTKCRAWPRKTTLQPALAPSKRKGFAASSIDTARPQENQRLETRHVGASKRAFCARHPPIFTLCGFKIDVFLRVFLGTSKFATLKSMFCVRLPSIFTTSHKMPHLPRNLHLVATWRSPDNAIRKNTQHDTTEVKCCHCHAKWRWTRPKCCACHENCNSSCENVANVLRLPHETTFDTLQNTSECHEVPQLQRETKQREVWNFKNDLFCSMALTRTVADGLANGCGRLGNVERTHPQPPDPQSETGTLATHSGKKGFKNKYLLDAKIAISLYPHSAAPIKHWSIVPNNLKTMTMQYAKPQKSTAKTIEKQHDVTWLQLKGVVMHYWGRCCMHFKNAIHLDKQNSLSKEEVPMTTFCASKCPGS